MTEIYSNADLDAVTAQKRNCLIYFFSVTAVFVAAVTVIFVWFLLEPYGTPKKPWLLTLECVLTGLYAIFAYIYLAIRFSRVRRYCVMLYRALNRKPTEGEATFMRFNGEVNVKDGVDFKSMTLVEWSDKEQEYMERYVLLDVEKPRPDFRVGDALIIKTYSNILVGYEITNRTDLAGTPFEEVAK